MWSIRPGLLDDLGQMLTQPGSHRHPVGDLSFGEPADTRQYGVQGHAHVLVVALGIGEGYEAVRSIHDAAAGIFEGGSVGVW